MNNLKVNHFKYPIFYQIYCVAIMICFITLDVVCILEILSEGIKGIMNNIVFFVLFTISFLYLTVASIKSFIRSIEKIALCEERICIGSLFGKKELKIKELKTIRHNYFLETTVLESQYKKIKVKNQLSGYDEFYNMLMPIFSKLDRYYNTKIPIEINCNQTFKYLPIGIISFLIVSFLLSGFKEGKMSIIELIIIEIVLISSLFFVWYVYSIMSPRRYVMHDTHIEMIWAKNKKIYKINDLTEVKYRRSFFNALDAIDLRFADNSAIILSQTDVSYPLLLFDEYFIKRYCNIS